VPGASIDQLIGGVTAARATAGCQTDQVCVGTLTAVLGGLSGSPTSLKEQTQAANGGLLQVLGGIGAANDLSSTTLNGGLNQVAGGLALTVSQVNNNLLVGLQGINTGLQTLRAGLTNADFNGGTSNPRCSTAVTPPKAGYCGFTEGLAQLVAGLNQAVAGLGQLDAGAEQASAGAGDLAAGIATAGDGAAQLSAGLKQVGQKVPAAVDGADQLADGSEKVAAGANKLADGLNDQLAPGANELAAGLGSLQAAADGAQQLSDGLVQAKDGNQQIVDGSGELSKRGSKKLVEAGDATAREFAKEYAVMQALNVKGAENGMPFGAAAGSSDNRGAYDITIAPVGHVGGSNNAGRGLVALVVLGAGAFLATMVRARFA
jgi:putative membrane protein